MKKGFTLIEILIVVGVFVIVLGYGFVMAKGSCLDAEFMLTEYRL